MITLSNRQAACLAAMEIPLWLKRDEPQLKEVWQVARNQHLVLVSEIPHSKQEHQLWQAILKAIQVKDTHVENEIPSEAICLGKEGMPSLSEMLLEPKRKAILWKRLQQCL